MNADHYIESLIKDVKDRLKEVEHDLQESDLEEEKRNELEGHVEGYISLLKKLEAIV